MWYDWDKEKDRANFKKHGVRFEEAQTVFEDPFHVETYDEEHTEEEDRFIAIGFSHRNRQLIVVFCERSFCGGEEVIRIISARKAKRVPQKGLGRV